MESLTDRLRRHAHDLVNGGTNASELRHDLILASERIPNEDSAWVQPPDAPRAAGYAPPGSALSDQKTVVGEVAALLAPQGAGWQSIETAPKDGTPILGCKLTWTHPYVFCFLNSPGLLEGWHDFNVSAEGRRPHDLTHWMPLPSVPAALLAPQVQACSFCGTAHHAVALLIGPAPESAVFICDGCVRTCLDIMREKALLAPQGADSRREAVNGLMIRRGAPILETLRTRDREMAYQVGMLLGDIARVLDVNDPSLPPVPLAAAALLAKGG